MHGHWLHKSFAGVGILVEDITKTTVTSCLDFRAACNKIIHAKKVHFDGETHVDTGVLHITPTVFLYGVKQKVEWKVTLDIVAFCRAAGNVIV